MAQVLMARSFTLPDKNSFLGSYDPIYETSVVKFLHLCFHAVIFAI